MRSILTEESDGQAGYEPSRTGLIQIAARAASLWERMESPKAFDSREAASAKAAARWKKWREIAAEGDNDMFRKRLSYDSLDEDAVRRFLGDMTAPEAFGLPPWTVVLSEVFRECKSHAQTVRETTEPADFPFLDKDFPIPFEELLLPFMAVAERRIASATGGYASLAAAVRVGIERSLLQNISRICSRVLEVEFRTHLACRQLDGFPYPDPIRGCESREAYLAFVDDHVRSGWLPLCQEYCVMARLMAVSLLQWVEGSTEFLERYWRDLSEIRAVFFHGENPGDITHVRMDISDSHHGGRSVIALEFASGAKLIYKPKDMGLEAAYSRFLEWLHGLGGTLPFHCLRILEREGYGWVEFIDNRACRDEGEVRRFYRRTGQFLGLVHAFNGMDFHFENIIACGEHPVPVDLETIYHHVVENAIENPDLTDSVTALLRNSVLATDLLPNPVKINDSYYDISAIARSAEEGNDFEVLCWKHINTDGLCYAYEKIKPGQADNLPRFQDRHLAPDNYVGEVVEGFSDMYKLLCRKREEFLAEGNAFHRIFSQPARFIFRSTYLYLTTLKRAFHPDCMREGVDFSIQLDVLARQFIRAAHRPKAWPLAREEMEAFWRTDIPKFTAHGDRDSLVLPSGETVEGCFVDSAWNRAREKLLNFGDEDLRWQIALINGSMDARDAKWLMGYPPCNGDAAEAEEPLDAAGLLEHTAELARGIEAAAVHGSNGEPGWLVLQFLAAKEQFALRPMEFDLYNGRCGLALFFAALEKKMPGHGYGETARAALAIVLRWLAKADDKDILSIGLGGLVGIPSLVYALSRVGWFLGEEELVEEAGTLARRIGPRLIESDKALDLLGGAAGAILCLLACHRVGGGPGILDIAESCGAHLLRNRTPDKRGCHTWPTLGGRHLTGFSHGAAGISYALLQLYHATGRREYLEAAQDGIRFEGYEFAPEHNNWPDHREYRNPADAPDCPAYMVRWCHGAPGIGLARLGGLADLDTPDIRRDIQAALATSLGSGLQPRDHICCGNMGLVETFLHAGITLGESQWTREAMRITSRVVTRARRKGSFGVTFRNGFSNPSLFQGSAGIGYQMLRVAFPDDIPAVLLLE